MATGPVGLSFVISLEVIIFLNFTLAFYKLSLFIKYKGFEWSLAQLSLGLEIISCLGNGILDNIFDHFGKIYLEN